MAAKDIRLGRAESIAKKWKNDLFRNRLLALPQITPVKRALK
jgi:hypothetical protein